MRRKKTEISAFSWYGGKTYHLDWLLPIINSVPHKSYVESFSGSAAILLNKIPSEVEVYNDVYGDVVNFFKVLRTDGPKLIELLQLTPYAREEYVASLEKESNPLEKARKFFVKARQVRNGLATMATPGKWSYTKKDSRNKKSLPVNQWLNAIDGLDVICERIKDVQIECLDALDVIERYDTEKTLHYVDPPYVNCTGNYSDKYDEKQHEKLLALLLKIKGKVVLSGYASELYSSTLKGWQESKRKECFTNTTLVGGKKNKRQEIIWSNFNFELDDGFEK